MSSSRSSSRSSSPAGNWCECAECGDCFNGDAVGDWGSDWGGCVACDASFCDYCFSPSLLRPCDMCEGERCPMCSGHCEDCEDLTLCKECQPKHLENCNPKTRGERAKAELQRNIVSIEAMIRDLASKIQNDASTPPKELLLPLTNNALQRRIIARGLTNGRGRAYTTMQPPPKGPKATLIQMLLASGDTAADQLQPDKNKLSSLERQLEETRQRLKEQERQLAEEGEEGEEGAGEEPAPKRARSAPCAAASTDSAPAAATDVGALFGLGAAP